MTVRIPGSGTPEAAPRDTVARRAAEQVIDLLAETTEDLTQSLDRLRSIMDPLLSHPNLFELAVPRDANHLGKSWWLYYDTKLLVILAELKRLEDVPVHNHGTFEAVSVYRGAIKYVSYRRKDDGSQTYYADLDTFDDRILREGDIVAVPPPPHDIHGFVGLAEKSYLIGLSGPLQPDRQYFDPARGFFVERDQKAWRLEREHGHDH